MRHTFVVLVTTTIVRGVVLRLGFKLACHFNRNFMRQKRYAKTFDKLERPFPRFKIQTNSRLSTYGIPGGGIPYGFITGS